LANVLVTAHEPDQAKLLVAAGCVEKRKLLDATPYGDPFSTLNSGYDMFTFQVTRQPQLFTRKHVHPG
jgi:hypothetical protein